MKLHSRLLQQLPDATIQEFVLGSPAMHNIMTVVRQVAPHDVNVLITGESGTGKELLAKIIHLQSPRAARPFVPVNCGILSGLIFEDKLFGHEKGAFTGAVDRKEGCFEMAHTGSLFLDEVSELPFENQVDFLRVLEDYRFTRIGGSAVIEVNVRLISATNKDLRELIRKGAFREDLFYRLHVVPIQLPPLRDRREAIPKLVDHFLDYLSAKYKKPKPALTDELMDTFNRYEWPGNVRELKNLVERIFIITDKERIGTEMLPSDFLWHLEEPLQAMELAEVRKAAETRAITRVLRRTKGNREKAAALLGISPRTLRHKMQHYHIDIKPAPGP
jgi:transcriptional regulator with PAS, ATPase and Fis domain